MSQLPSPIPFDRHLALAGNGVCVTFYQPFRIRRITGQKDKLEHVLMAFHTEGGLKNLLLSPSTGGMHFPADLPNNDPHGLATLSKGPEEPRWHIVDLKSSYKMCWPVNFDVHSTARDVGWSCVLTPIGDKRQQGEHIIVRGPFDKRIFVPGAEKLVGKGERLVEQGHAEKASWYLTEYSHDQLSWRQMHYEGWLDENIALIVTGQFLTKNEHEFKQPVQEVADSLRWCKNV
jgi:hypothetical protein